MFGLFYNKFEIFLDKTTNFKQKLDFYQKYYFLYKINSSLAIISIVKHLH